MISAIQAFLDAKAKGLPACAESWLDAIPGWQITARFDEFAPQCPDRRGASVERRPANALNVEIGAPVPRCIQRMPAHWTGSGRSALRWLASGGSALVFGECCCRACPRARIAQRASEAHQDATVVEPVRGGK